MIKIGICECNEKWLEETRTRHIKQIDDEKRQNLSMKVIKKHSAKS